MAEVKAIVLRAAGINCDMETEYALELAGAKAQRIHINKIIRDKALLDEFQIIVFPGGFSYGDDVAAGKILANQIVHHLYEPVQKFIETRLCIIFMSRSKNSSRTANLCSESATVFRCWSRRESCRETVRLAGRQTSPSQITTAENSRTDGSISRPRATSVFSSSPAGNSGGQIAFKYVDKNGNGGDYPVNPNGSMDSIAGLTDTTGRVLGLMPHPERFVRPTQHPHWSRLGADLKPDGTTIFDNAVKYVREHL